MSGYKRELDARRFVSNALQNDGIGVLEYPSGGKAAFKISYITDFPAIGSIMTEKQSYLQEILRKQAENGFRRRR